LKIGRHQNAWNALLKCHPGAAGGIELPLTIESGQGHVGLRKSKRRVAALDANAGASSHLTRRWRKPDSNSPSHLNEKLR
jgi:hypothetical protein